MSVLKTLGVTACVIVVVALAFIYSGLYNVAADEPHLGGMTWLLSTIQSRSVAARLDGIEVPGNLDQLDRIERGGENYGSMCQSCHLGPEMSPTALYAGLNPTPPQLTAHAGHHSLAEQFWIIKHGVKMTGMPAWGETHSDEELWDIVAFVKKLPQMTAEDFDAYTASP